MRKGRIVIISGPSGSGKTTLHKRLLLSRRFRGKLVKSISATTRPRRPGERHGRDYLFFSKDVFLAKKTKKYFLEWQRVFGRYYGTPHDRAEELLKAGKNVLLCIDVKGARVVRRWYPDAISIFINAPSIAVLKNRLRKRASESMADLRLRLSVAKREIKEARQYTYVVVNDDLKKALKKLEHILQSELK